MLLGCGKMGSALLSRWLSDGLGPDAVSVIEPCPSNWLKDQNVTINGEIGSPPSVCVIAVKPQVMDNALPAVSQFGNGPTLFISIAAGKRIDFFEKELGPRTPIIRSMPNTPASIGQGITAVTRNSRASDDHVAVAKSLLSAVGETVELPDEALLDAVTAVSGSGPAYAFLLIETLTAAGVEQGLTRETAEKLAIATVAGAGRLAKSGQGTPAFLRESVTSPGGTTAAALKILMDGETGLQPLMSRAVEAAAERSRELGG
ncbi:MAG: pyrroline-5-carboxylate reductase [Albidovulum sp.]|nr:pyrroline-5-carboxylate reductase [Albidovulum sp.]